METKNIMIVGVGGQGTLLQAVYSVESPRQQVMM